MTELKLTKQQWLAWLQNDPDQAAYMLSLLNSFGDLIVDAGGALWIGGIGPGYGCYGKIDIEARKDGTHA